MEAMDGLERFGVDVKVYTDIAARGVEEAFRLPVGALRGDEEAFIGRAALYMDGAGVSDRAMHPEAALGLHEGEFLPD